MRRGACLVVILSVLSACSTYNGSRRTARVGLIVAGAGLAGLIVFGVIAGVTSHSDEGPRCDEGNTKPICETAFLGWLASFLAIPSGLAVAGMGGIGMLAYPAVTAEQRAARAKRAENETRQAEQTRAAAEAKEQAWRLTKQAAESARAGDCPTVVQRAREVEGLDADFYAVVFVRDAAIKRCLEGGAGSGR